MLVENFKQGLDVWINQLENYDLKQLYAKPSPNSWSIGQVYMHLIENTDWFLEQAKICSSTNENANEEASPAGKAMLVINEFPDVVLEGPPENNATQQPESNGQLISDLKQLRDEISDLGKVIYASEFKGKTKHPGLGYFNAVEWFQFAEMHLRHHLRQKKRIDDFLKANTF